MHPEPEAQGWAGFDPNSVGQWSLVGQASNALAFGPAEVQQRRANPALAFLKGRCIFTGRRGVVQDQIVTWRWAAFGRDGQPQPVRVILFGLFGLPLFGFGLRGVWVGLLARGCPDAFQAFEIDIGGDVPGCVDLNASHIDDESIGAHVTKGLLFPVVIRVQGQEFFSNVHGLAARIGAHNVEDEFFEHGQLLMNWLNSGY